ncbi:MAG: hypothetical protein ACP5O6_04025 [Candidatus Baltobacteraceae bacterium]
MKRLSIFFIGVAFVVGAMMAPALADNFEPSNGLILLRNSTNEYVKVTEIRHMVGSLPGIVIDRDLTIPPGRSIYANRCCYAAGSVYRITYMNPPGAEHKTGWILITMGLGKIGCLMGIAPLAASDEVDFRTKNNEIQAVDGGRLCQ